MKKYLLFLLFLFAFLFINAQSKGVPSGEPGLIFDYDEAGNQIERKFSSDISITVGKKSKEKEKSTAPTEEPIVYENKFISYPNPTDGQVTLSWEQDVTDLIQKIEIVGYTTPYYREISFDSTNLNLEIDLTNQIQGVYFVNFTLSNSEIITKKIIKNKPPLRDLQ
jgi:hypothetical protein